MRARLTTALGLAALLYGGGASPTKSRSASPWAPPAPGASLGVNYKNAFQLMPADDRRRPRQVHHSRGRLRSDRRGEERQATRDRRSRRRVDGRGIGALDDPDGADRRRDQDAMRSRCRRWRCRRRSSAGCSSCRSRVPLMMGAVVDDMKTSRSRPSAISASPIPGATSCCKATEESGRSRRHQDRRRGALCARRHSRHRPDRQDPRRQSRRGRGRRIGHRRRAAANRAARKGYKRPDLPQPRHRQPRVHQGRRRVRSKARSRRPVR